MNLNRPLSNRYCEYHEDTCHDTERCFQLINLIEGKIRKGQLSHFVQPKEPRRSSVRDSDKIIDVISGGFAAGGVSNNLKKSYAREVYRIDSKKPKRNPNPTISFSDADYLAGLIEGHQDALVITTQIGNKTVKKILVDNGSSIDILYHSAFSRMNLGDRKIQDAKGVSLYGFTGNKVRVVGVIDLPVLFGIAPNQSWQIVKFHIVNVASMYNAILWRTSLATLKAIISNPHLKWYFPPNLEAERSVEVNKLQDNVIWATRYQKRLKSLTHRSIKWSRSTQKKPSKSIKAIRTSHSKSKSQRRSPSKWKTRKKSLK